ncbi:hypothetical protein [Deinococcus pimensis]|uniref:hypothetical protein n=1 Tax=Deinococcus pimensis TaxID=309888 RepID=UPI00048282CE|nr:hypothetical protein [Deinococcus pimensis]
MKFDPSNPVIAYAQTTLRIQTTEKGSAAGSDDAAGTYTCRSVSYGDSVEFSEVEGASQIALGTTRGQYRTDEGTLVMYADDLAELMEMLGSAFYETTFQIVNIYEKLGSSKLTKDELIGCRFTKRSVSDEAGPDALTRDISFKPSYIRWNEKDPLSKMPKMATKRD